MYYASEQTRANCAHCWRDKIWISCYCVDIYAVNVPINNMCQLIQRKRNEKEQAVIEHIIVFFRAVFASVSILCVSLYNFEFRVELLTNWNWLKQQFTLQFYNSGLQTISYTSLSLNGFIQIFAFQTNTNKCWNMNNERRRKKNSESFRFCRRRRVRFVGYKMNVCYISIAFGWERTFPIFEHMDKKFNVNRNYSLGIRKFFP